MQHCPECDGKGHEVRCETQLNTTVCEVWVCERCHGSGMVESRTHEDNGYEK